MSLPLSKLHHRSLQGKLQCIVEATTSTMSIKEMKEVSQAWRKLLKPKSFTGNAAMLREVKKHLNYTPINFNKLSAISCIGTLFAGY